MKKSSDGRYGHTTDGMDRIEAMARKEAEVERAHKCQKCGRPTHMRRADGSICDMRKLGVSSYCMCPKDVCEICGKPLPQNGINPHTLFGQGVCSN
jgi:ribosomal protein L37AE/L43A